MSFISPRRTHFNISCMANLVVVNSLHLCLSGKAFIYLHNQRITLPDKIFLDSSFYVSTLKVSFYSLLSDWVSTEKSADSLINDSSFIGKIIFSCPAIGKKKGFQRGSTSSRSVCFLRLLCSQINIWNCLFVSFYLLSW